MKLIKFELLLCVLFSICIVAYAKTASDHIDSLNETEIKNFFEILNLPQNKHALKAFSSGVWPTKFAQYSMYDNTSFVYQDGGQEEYRFKLYRLDLFNNHKIYYVITNEYLGSGYSGSSNIATIFLLDKNQKLAAYPDNDYSKIFLADPHSGFYTNINGFSYCGRQICAEFAIEPPASWNAMPGINTFVMMADKIVFIKHNSILETQNVNRVVNKIKLTGDKKTSGFTQFKQHLEKQLRQHKLIINLFDYPTDPSHQRQLTRYLLKGLVCT